MKDNFQPFLIEVAKHLVTKLIEKIFTRKNKRK
jgi:hypothetical protein